MAETRRQTRGEFDKYREIGAYHWRGYPERGKWRGFDPILYALYSTCAALAAHGAPADGLSLEVGTGDGVFQQVLRDFSDAPIIGMDLELEGLRLARRELRLRGMLPCLVAADATTLPIRTNSIHTVVAIEVIEHIPDDRALVKEFARVLRPGGRLVLTTPIRRIGRPPYDVRHVREYRPEELVEAIDWCFSVEDVFGLIGHQEFDTYRTGGTWGRVQRLYRKATERSHPNIFSRRLPADSGTARHMVLVGRATES